MDLVRTLLELQREKKWGVLDVEGGATHTCIYVADGKPVFAEAGSLCDALGRLLVREGAMTDAQYATVLARMTEGLVTSEPMRFGEVAIKLGFLTPDQVQEALSAQVRQKVVRCIALANATFTFRAGKDWSHEVARFPSSVEPLVLHAAASFDGERAFAILRPNDGTRARLHKPVAETSAAFAFGGAEERFLGMIDGKRTVRELLAHEDVDATAILVALALTEHVAIADAPIAEGAPEKPPAPRVSFADVARESRRRLVPFTAARAHDADAPQASRAQADAILKRMWEARRAKENPKPKTSGEARLLAEAAFQLGASHLRANSLARAVQELRRAAELAPDATEYRLYAQWAEFANEHGSLDEAEKDARLASLEIAAEAALAQVSDHAFAHYVLGQVFMHRNDERAMRSFKRAARLDPDLIDAVRHVRLLELRKRRSEPRIEEKKEAPNAAPVISLGGAPNAVPPKAPPTATIPDVVEEVSAPEIIASAPALLPVNEPSAITMEPARTRVRARGALVALASACVLAAAGALLYVRTQAHPARAAAATARASTASSAPSAASSAPSAPSSAPSVAPSAPSAPSAPPSDEFGFIRATSAASRGHRIEIDGRPIGDAPGPYRVRCGVHSAQIGSHGTSRRVDVACGATLDLDAP